MGGKPKCAIEQVREIANTKGFELLETEYINNSTPMRMRCQHGHEFKISFQNLKKGNGCSYCYKYRKLTHDDVYQKCKENGINLLRISYWEDIENTIKLYFKENFNDYVS